MGLIAGLKAGAKAAKSKLDDYATRVVYHGSPHDFDAFDLSKIGTGEGAQAYGHGLYFSESDRIAKWYRDNLTEPTPQYMGKAVVDDGMAMPFEDEALARAFREAVREVGGNANKDELIEATINVLENDFPRSDFGIDWRDVTEKRKEFLDVSGKGKLYRAEIPTSDYMLDWDKPLSEQVVDVSPIVEELKSLPVLDRDSFGEPGKLFRSERQMLDDGTLKGSDLYRIYERERGGKASATDALKKLGIVGINYIGDSSGVRNAVVFDDKLVKILEKGNADPRLLAALGITAGGVAMAMPQDAEAGVTDDVVRAVAKAGDLDMSQAARMARAAEQGYNTSAYHATGVDFDAFQPSRWRGANYFSDTPDGAMRGAMAGSGEHPTLRTAPADRILPVKIGGKIFGQDPMPDWWLPETMTYGTFRRIVDGKAKLPIPESVMNSLSASDVETINAMRRADASRFYTEAIPEAEWGKYVVNNPDGSIDTSPYFPLSLREKPVGNALRYQDIEGAEGFVSPWSNDVPSERRALLAKLGFTAARVNDEGGKSIAVFDPSTVRSQFAKFDPANIGKNDLLGAADPRILAPTAAAAAGAGMLAADPAAAFDYGAPHTLPGLPSLPPEYNEFARRRASKRGLWDQVKEAAQATATVGSAVAGGLVGDLSRAGGYINPFMPVERTEAGARAIEDRLQYIPSQPNRYLEGLGGFIDNAAQDLKPITDALPESVPGQIYNALPERVQGLLRIGADWAF